MYKRTQDREVNFARSSSKLDEGEIASKLAIWSLTALGLV